MKIEYFSDESIYQRWLKVCRVYPAIDMNLQKAIMCDKVCRNILESKIDEEIGINQLLAILKL